LLLFGRYGYEEIIKCLTIKTLLFCRLSTGGYEEIIKCLTIKTLLFCRLSTGVPILYIQGRLYRRWRIETYLWMSVYV
jgi:hypothetical protein